MTAHALLAMLMTSALGAASSASSRGHGCLKWLATQVHRVMNPGLPTADELEAARAAADRRVLAQLRAFRAMPHDFDKFSFALTEVERLNRELRVSLSSPDVTVRQARSATLRLFGEYHRFAAQAYARAPGFEPIDIPAAYASRAESILKEF